MLKMEKSHAKFVEGLNQSNYNFDNGNGTYKELQGKWRILEKIINLAEEQEAKENKPYKARLKYTGRIVQKYADELDKESQSITNQSLWEKFVQDTGGEEGIFLRDKWEGTMKLAIELFTKEPFPIKNLADLVGSYRDEL